MIQVAATSRIFVFTNPTDMRKSFIGGRLLPDCQAQEHPESIGTFRQQESAGPCRTNQSPPRTPPSTSPKIVVPNAYSRFDDRTGVTQALGEPRRLVKYG
jgi:hypothetical protein